MSYLNLNKYTKHTSPFYYYSSDKIFEEEVYKVLNSEFPKISDFDSKGILSNENRYDFNLSHIKSSKKISELWKKVIEEFISFEFFKELCEKFNIDSSKYKNIVLRKDNNNNKEDVIVDFQFSFNLQNKDVKSCFLRPPHIDSKDKLIVILLYFPESEVYNEYDRGELIIYETKEPYESTYMSYKFMLKNISIIDKIYYNHNNGILFLNSDKSVHAPMSLINNKESHRRFVNIVFMKNN